MAIGESQRRVAEKEIASTIGGVRCDLSVNDSTNRDPDDFPIDQDFIVRLLKRLFPSTDIQLDPFKRYLRKITNQGNPNGTEVFACDKDLCNAVISIVDVRTRVFNQIKERNSLDNV